MKPGIKPKDYSMPFNLVTSLDPASRVDTEDRGLHYGDGLFETILLTNGKLQYWDEHYFRLQQSSQYLKIKCPDKRWFEQKLIPFFKLKKSLVVKIMITRGSGGRGLKWLDKLQENIYIFHYDFQLSSVIQQVKMYTSEITLPKYKLLAGLKHLNRLDYVLATEALSHKNEFHDALLLDTKGRVIETIINNIFFVIEGQLCTPKLNESGVRGILRGLVIKQMKAEGKKVKIAKFNLKALKTASEIFICNSVQGIRPVIVLDTTKFKIGPVTQQLQSLLP